MASAERLATYVFVAGFESSCTIFPLPNSHLNKDIGIK
jgi:hypothetical protein